MKALSNYFVIIYISVIVISCGNKTPQVKDQPINDSVSVKDSSTIKQEITYTNYQGVLPCNKCDGINTTLSISSDYQNASLSLSHQDNPFVEEGYHYPMNTERGFEDDPDATVYILNWDKPVNDQRIFVRSTGKDNEVFEIGKNRKRFKDEKNHTLTKTR